MNGSANQNRKPELEELFLRLKAGDLRGLFGAEEQQQSTPDGRKLSKLDAEQDREKWRKEGLRWEG